MVIPKLAFDAPVNEATTLYEPAVAFAVGMEVVASPFASEIAVVVANSVGNVQDAPDAGEVNSTLTPATG